jgi:3-isopropylmalate/(R)-2-methylmalate dehydratase large subunit
MSAAAPVQSLAQKLIARAAGRRGASARSSPARSIWRCFTTRPGRGGSSPCWRSSARTIWDKSKVVLVMDHYVPERDEAARRIVRIARDWAREQQLPHVYDSQGICHVVVPQHGHIRPGMFCVGGDSHSPTGGAFGAYMFGIGSTEMLGVVVTGEIWLRVPQTIAMHWSGRLAAGVCAKDMMLSMIARFGMNGADYQAVEFTGDAVRALSMQERMTLCNMSAELGAQTGLVAPDDVTRRLAARDRRGGPCPATAMDGLGVDPGSFDVQHDFDAAALGPQLAAPHSPAHGVPLAAHADTRIDVAYIGACTGAKLDDLRFAAQVLKGRRVASGVQFLVAPASLKDRAQAEAEGTMQILTDAGCRRPAQRLRRLRGLRRQLRRGPDRDLQHGAQLQGPHGAAEYAGVSGFGLHRGRLRAARAHHRSARGAGMTTPPHGTGSGISATTSTPMRWRPAPTCNWASRHRAALPGKPRAGVCARRAPGRRDRWPGATSASAPRASRPPRCWCTWVWPP